MNLHSLTPGEKRALVTRDGRKAKVIDIFADGRVLVKAVGTRYPYQVSSEGRYRYDGEESVDDVLVQNGKTRIRLYLYEDGTAAWRDENVRLAPSKTKVLKQMIFMEI
jgi:hypothetical protein